MNIIASIADNRELFEFLMNLKDEEIYSLKEGVNDFEDSFVNTQTILHLITVWEFKD